MKQAMLVPLALMIVPMLAMKTSTRFASQKNNPAGFDVTGGANLSENGTATVENIVQNNLLHDFADAETVEKPEVIEEAEGEGAGNKTNETKGFEGLAEKLEWFMLKVAQLETVVEIQQLEINKLNAKFDGHLEVEHDTETPQLSLLELKQQEEAKSQQAQTILKRVFKKHLHEMKKRTFDSSIKATEGMEPSARPARAKGPQPNRKVQDPDSSLLERRQASDARSVEEAKWGFIKSIPVVGDVAQAGEDVVTSGAGLVGDALGDAYAQATDKIAFVANTVIDTVGKAMDILLRGFTDWRTWCSLITPSASFSAHGFHVFFGATACAISLMGQGIELFHFHWPTYNLPFPEPLYSVTKIGQELATCVPGTGASFLACLGGKIVNNLPPLQAAHDLGHAMTSCPHRDGGGMLTCLGGSIVNHIPPLKAVHDLGQAMTSCPHRDGGGMVTCLGGSIVNNIPPLKAAHDLGHAMTSCTQRDGGGMVTCLGGSIVNGIPPLKAVHDMGHELVHCTQQSSNGLVTCLGNKIINYVPPLSYFNKMNDILADFLEGFSRVAATIAGQVLKSGSSFIQEAVKTKFPAAGAPALVHHQGQNLVVTTHTQKRRAPMSALQTAGDEDPPKDGITFELHNDDGNEQSKLITQFDGFETDTSSCLAFAPSHRAGGEAGPVNSGDWQVENADDFVELKPWAVPCGTKWMKRNWDKWQGYSFYTGSLAIERCVTVTYAINVQPVIAFIGGLQFDVMPKPLASVDTTVCWPKGMPDGQDLSMLRTEIKSSGVLLYSKTLRLNKRFGGGTQFVPQHVKASNADFRTPTNPRNAMSRTKLMQMNESLEAHEIQNRSSEEGGEGVFEWMEEDDFYLASANYTQDLGINLTSEHRGTDAKRRLSLAQTESAGVLQLFNFVHPGLVNFNLQAVLDHNSFEMRTQMGFGPFSSEQKKIKLVDIANQFAVVLHALPWLSAASRKEAIHALQNSRPDVMPTTLKPGTTVGIHNRFFSQYVNIHGNLQVHSSGTHAFEGGYPADWIWERFTVIDAGAGEIALHHQRTNSFLGVNAHGAYGIYAPASQLPAGWLDQRFEVVTISSGYFGLFNRHSQNFLSVGPHHATYLFHSPTKHLPPGHTHQQFRAQLIEPRLKPGAIVALYNTIHQKYMRMNHGGMEVSGVHPHPTQFSHTWHAEQFIVVDAGNGDIALFSWLFNRFVMMAPSHMASSEVRAGSDDLPDAWTYERFQVVPVENGLIALWNVHHNKFVGMGPEALYVSPPMAPQGLPDGWTHQRFQVVDISHLHAADGVNPHVPGGWTFNGLR